MQLMNARPDSPPHASSAVLSKPTPPDATAVPMPTAVWAVDPGTFALADGSAETYQALRAATEDDPGLARFEQGLRDLISAFPTA